MKLTNNQLTVLRAMGGQGGWLQSGERVGGVKGLHLVLRSLVSSGLVEVWGSKHRLTPAGEGRLNAADIDQRVREQTGRDILATYHPEYIRAAERSDEATRARRVNSPDRTERDE